MTAIAFLENAVIFLINLPLWILVVLLKIGLIARLLFRWNFPLSRLPGPRLAAWTRLWWLQVVYHANVPRDLALLEQRFGPIVRIAPNSVLVSDPEVTRRILAVGSKYKRGPWFDSLRLHPLLTNVVSERDPKKHQQLRSILNSGLSGKDISMESIIEQHISEWLEGINRKSEPAHGVIQVDLSRSLPFLTLDIIAHLCFGEPFHCLQEDVDPYGFLATLRSGVAAQQYLSSLLELKDVLFLLGRIPILGSHIFPSMKDKEGIGRIMMCIHEVVERRLTSRSEAVNGFEGDMLGSFLSRGLTLKQASSELVIVLTSGVGSTSYAAQAIIRCIVADPDIYRKLQLEIDDAISKTNIRRDQYLPNSVICEMPYLQACKLEGLRLHPPITLLRERQVPPDGDDLNGYHLPGGTFVGLNSRATQLHPIYGDDREIFHPERWLIKDKSRLKEMHHTLDLVFGYGASKCLGVNIADMELNKIILELFRHYNVLFTRPDSPWQSQGDLMVSRFQVQLTRRNF